MERWNVFSSLRPLVEQYQLIFLVWAYLFAPKHTTSTAHKGIVPGAGILELEQRTQLSSLFQLPHECTLSSLFKSPIGWKTNNSSQTLLPFSCHRSTTNPWLVKLRILLSWLRRLCVELQGLSSNIKKTASTTKSRHTAVPPNCFPLARRSFFAQKILTIFNF